MQDGRSTIAAKGVDLSASQRPQDDTERIAGARRAFAHDLDRRLVAVVHRDAIARRAIGRLAQELLRRHAHKRLGFTRLGDYTRERLGISARELESAAAVARLLDELPAIAKAFERGELTWTQVRLLGAVAAADTEMQWLDDARGRTVRELDALIKTSHIHADTADAEADEDDSAIDGEPCIRVRIACPGRVRSLFRRSVELARRMCGAPVPIWQAVEAMAAEGLSGRASTLNLHTPVAHDCRTRDTAIAPPAHATEDGRADEDAHLEETTALAELTRDATDLDPFDLDERLRTALRMLRTLAPETGRLLWAMLDRRQCRALGYESRADYVRERLGMSMRKAQGLVTLHKHCARVPQLADEYESGGLSWVRALTIVPVIDRGNADAWIARAHAVTVRRLVREVDWALDWCDASAGGTGFDPPPLGSALIGPFDTPNAKATRRSDRQILSPATPPVSSDADAQTCAHGRIDWHAMASDAEIRFVAPASVVALFRCAVHASRRHGEPRWRAVEHLLTAVIHEWERQPPHRDPVFNRDGWRCAVPACSSRGPFHDHHIQFRSRGGANDLANRTAVCVAHHQYAIHYGIVRSWGDAPDGVHWELGVRADGPPLMRLVGDCYVAGELAWLQRTRVSG